MPRLPTNRRWSRSQPRKALQCRTAVSQQQGSFRRRDTAPASHYSKQMLQNQSREVVVTSEVTNTKTYPAFLFPSLQQIYSSLDIRSLCFISWNQGWTRALLSACSTAELPLPPTPNNRPLDHAIWSNHCTFSQHCQLAHSRAGAKPPTTGFNY